MGRKKESAHDFDLSEKISIPESIRELPTPLTRCSLRLATILGNIRSIGDLHGVSYSQLRKKKNSGLKTLRELKQFVAAVKTPDARVSATLDLKVKGAT